MAKLNYGELYRAVRDFNKTIRELQRANKDLDLPSYKDYKYVSIIVVDIIDISNVKFLMVKKKKCTTWEFPGGKIEKTDTSADVAALRELYEETGITVDKDLEYIFDYHAVDIEKKLAASSKVFLCKYKGNEIVTPPQNFEMEQAKWLSINEIKNTDLSYPEITKAVLSTFVLCQSWI